MCHISISALVTDVVIKNRGSAASGRVVARMAAAGALALALVLGAAPARAEPQYWSAYELKIVQRPAVELDVSFEARLDEALLANGLYLAGSSLGHRLSPYLDTMITARYLGNASAGSLAHSYRLEFEFNPRLALSDRTTLQARNRVELIAAGRAFTGVRGRHRLRVVHALPPGTVLDRVFLGYEMYYEQGVTRQEIVPTGVRLTLHRQLTFSLFYLLRLDGLTPESITHVVATRLSYTL